MAALAVEAVVAESVMVEAVMAEAAAAEKAGSTVHQGRRVQRRSVKGEGMEKEKKTKTALGLIF